MIIIIQVSVIIIQINLKFYYFIYFPFYAIYVKNLENAVKRQQIMKCSVNNAFVSIRKRVTSLRNICNCFRNCRMIAFLISINYKTM